MWKKWGDLLLVLCLATCATVIIADAAYRTWKLIHKDEAVLFCTQQNVGTVFVVTGNNLDVREYHPNEYKEEKE